MSHPITDYEVLVTGKGKELHVYSVPDNLLNAIKPHRPKPLRPKIDMEIKGGKTQSRPIKKGDSGWEEYQEDVEKWEEEYDELQKAVSYILALKDYQFPNPLVFSDRIQMLIDDGMLDIPEHPYLKKLMYLRDMELGRHDEYNLDLLIMKLSGVDDEVIDQIKANFRSVLLGETSRRLAERDELGSKEPEGDN